MLEQNYIDMIHHDIFKLVAEAILSNDTGAKIDAIVYQLRPKKSQEVTRCCIYKDRAILRYRCMAALGFLPDDENDDTTPLSDYAKLAMERLHTPKQEASTPFHVISSCDIACHACMKARYFVTNACQNCVAHLCTNACHFGAISIVNGISHIDEKKCRNCGKCLDVCPYCAIVKLTVPCEKACPVDAIKKDDSSGRAEIELVKCISCGRCMRACPFGAIVERSEIVDVLNLFRRNAHVTAIVAPAFAGQFDAPLSKVFDALKKLGFSECLEVATGADMTSRHEAEEFLERMGKRERFMTTSCCPAYLQAASKLIPELMPFVSSTPTPMHYTVELAVKKFPGTVVVFIGPCVAKRIERLGDPTVYAVLTFKEVAALFAASGIVLTDCTEILLGEGASPEGRKYAVSSGVAAAVQKQVGDRAVVKPVLINGLSTRQLRQLRNFAHNECPGNLVEVMACEGGCVNGGGVLARPEDSAKAVMRFSCGDG